MPSLSSRSLFARIAPLVVLLQLILPVLGHIEVVFPPGFNSKYDPQTLEADKDYSMTSPLAADGSNYPCKGYNTAANYAKLNPVATLTAGTSLAVELAGTATHGGGSCQWAVSYDEGKTFAVIASIIGSCPIGLKFDVPIPASLPSATKATLSWTWMNNLGNREMYQECSLVSITGSSSSSYTGPSLFRANTFADGTCITVEGQDVVFPNPGPSVQYLGSETSQSPATVLDNCPFNQDSNVTIGPSGSSSATQTTPRAASSSASASSTTTRVQATTTTSQAAATTTTRSSVTTQAPPTSQAQATTSSKASLNNPRTKTYLNNPRVKPTTSSKSSAPAATTPSSTRSAAFSFSTSSDLAASLGVTSSAPTTTPAPTSSSAPSSASATASTSASGEAYVQCNTATTWSLCGNGVCTFMGAVPAGTVCKNGAMVMARRKMVKRQEKGSHLRMAMVRRAKSATH